jgi:hypothetical protein
MSVSFSSNCSEQSSIQLLNNQMVFGSHQSQKGDEIISIHPDPKPDEGAPRGNICYHERSA